jgi:UDP-N-acetylmuramate--alanine ligase
MKEMKDIHTYENYYFIGIGGIGMSALVRYFKFSGASVSGYDRTPTPLTRQLEEESIPIIFDDEISLITKGQTPENTLIIFTPAVPVDLKIKNYFINHNFTVLKRSQVLGEITKTTYCLAVAGTHGKTTTSTLLGYLCKFANLPSTAFLGGISVNYDTNFIYSGNEISIVEADEFDRSFLRLSPDMAVITSTDADHLDIYGDFRHFLESFNEFANLVPKDGFLLVKKGLNIQAQHSTYSAQEKADYYAENVRVVNDRFEFDLVTPDEVIKDFVLHLPGVHNVENAVAALALGLKMGISPEVLHKGLAEFKGVKRRFTRITFPNGKIYIDDYAHHPTELNAAIEAVRALYPNKKLLTVFQPHLYTRTRDFADSFARSLEKSDELILLDIYPARELPIEAVTSRWLAEKIRLPKVEVSSLNDALKTIKTHDFDVLLTVGAGNIDTLYEPIIDWLNEA